jgi:short-subunit dehydrogenase
MCALDRVLAFCSAGEIAMNYKGLTALVTGASSGLGEEFARQLAVLGADLVLVARSEDKLNLLAAALREESGVQVKVMAVDLSSGDAVIGLLARLEEGGITVDILINNAGLGLFKDFLDGSIETQMEQIDVNVGCVVRLTHGLAPGMVSRKRGGIINIASSAGFQPLAGAAVYAATKSFVLLFTEALSIEVEKSGVRVLAACPGPVATGFFRDMNPKLSTKQMDQPTTIVRESLRAFEKRKRVVFPGKFKVWLGTLGARLLPRNVIARLAAGTVDQLNQK